MKEVIAIIRPQRWTETKARLQQLHIHALTQQRVLGRGRERGLRYLPRDGAANGWGLRYLPKRMITWIVEEHQVEPLIQAILAVNQTGQLGDGKIFVLPMVSPSTGSGSLEGSRAESRDEQSESNHASRE